jgi:RNA polymerase sigma-70 factor (ECF subfamily)
MTPVVNPESQPPADRFGETHWSLVRAAGASATVASRNATELLCRQYWQPLYTYVRRRGHQPHEAEDLTQEFFASLLSRNDFAALHPDQGKFRAFLLAAMNHFLAKAWRKESAQKRGGRATPLSLDTSLAEHCLGTAASTGATPEQAYDRQWAETVLEHAAIQLRAACLRDGRAALFRELNRFLSVPAAAGDYDAVAQRLGMNVPTVAKAVERLRRKYRDCVRREIAQTVGSRSELDEEMRYLLDIMA